MSLNDQTRLDRQHQLGTADQPSSFLREVLECNGWRIPPGLALDIATGKGRNARFLAERGFTVTGIDVSSVALEEARRRSAETSLQITWVRADLEQMQLPRAAYDLIVNFNYLQRSLIPHIKKSLKAGGHLIFETFLIDQQAVGRPKNPAYLLQHNELLDFFRDFRVLCYREGKFTKKGEAAFRAGIFARKIVRDET